MPASLYPYDPQLYLLQGWVDCFEKASLKGMVSGGGIDAANTVEEHVDIMKIAYELGKNL